MFRLLLLLGFIPFCLNVTSQFEKVFSKNLSYSWYNCDSHKTVYAICGSKLFKYSPPYITEKIFDLEKDGLPSYIDVNNSNKIVLFYENSQKIILLDSALHKIERPFYLEELGLFEISMGFVSNDMGLWFYNYLNNSLTKLNSSFLPIMPSINLNPYFQLPHVPNYIVSSADKIYINVPSYGILVINQNGIYLTAIQLRGLVDFQVENDIVFHYSDNTIYCHQIKTLQTRRIYIPEEPNTLNAWYYRNQIIVFSKEGFSVYNHDISPTE